MDNKAMYKLSYGLFVLIANASGKDNGCIINTAIQAASTPNTITICVNKANYTHDMIYESGKFALSVLSQEASFDLFKRFGFQSGKDVDKFDGFTDVARTESGLYYVTKGTNAFFAASVKDKVDLGSHTLFVSEPTEMEVLSETASATYEYYQSNIKPKPEEAKDDAPKSGWRCKVCGYVYEGEELPEDFICPICKHPASDFEKI